MEETRRLPHEGILQVNVFWDSIAKPAAAARVRVLESETGQLLGEGETDESGALAALSLPAPPPIFSQSPDLPRPFSQYNLEVWQGGERRTQIQHVQIYPESTALQRVILQEDPTEILVPYPTLWGDFPAKIPEEAVKPLPFPTDLVVLPKPVIPEYVVIHAGAPSNRTAKSYTVGFKDYIKNVASSEIYATWPREALKANILAIQSFTLNRVFTEWYRGKGYDFTITSSTAFDQAFSYGRTIYREISDVVDEVFTTYITKPDILQPLFTQYSDGRRVVRNGWLSQWGSKELATQGMDALKILKTYYGANIILKQAERVQGIPLSFPGYVLRFGASGEAVRTVQQQLNAIAKNFPAIPRVAEDGLYGTATEASVRRFQKAFRLPETGEVNFPTWYELSNIFVSVQKLS